MIGKNFVIFGVYPFLNANDSLERFLLRSIPGLELLYAYVSLMNLDMIQSLGVNMEWLQLGIFVCAMNGYKVDTGNVYA